MLSHPTPFFHDLGALIFFVTVLPARTASLYRLPVPQEIDELYKIFQVLGTPSEANWPGVSQLPDYKVGGWVGGEWAGGRLRRTNLCTCAMQQPRCASAPFASPSAPVPARLLPPCNARPSACLQDCFPQWRPQNLQSVVPTLDPLGVDLLARLLHYNPAERITARAALQHEYFQTP